VTLNVCILIRAINYKLIRDLCAAINRFCKSLEVVDVVAIILVALFLQYFSSHFMVTLLLQLLGDQSFIQPLIHTTTHYCQVMQLHASTPKSRQTSPSTSRSSLGVGREDHPGLK
jgi:hypothetical protein